MRALAAAVVVAAAGCVAHASPTAWTRVETVTVGATLVRLEYGPEDAGAARRVAAALERALPCAEQWGRLRVPVTIVLHPSHDALEAAVHREGYGWLRAWARFDTVDLQSPRTWNRFFWPGEAELEELLAHELTHCVMYQRAGTAWSWPSLGIPLWFREGMASVTAGQARRRATREELWAFYARAGRQPGGGPSGPGGGGGEPAAAGDGGARAGDPVTDPEPLYQREADVVYGAAHHAFQFLLDRYGAAAVQRLLARMAAGDTFAAAFPETFGIDARAFEGEFQRYLRWRGF